jgi:hypothetical protein
LYFGLFKLANLSEDGMAVFMDHATRPLAASDADYRSNAECPRACAFETTEPLDFPTGE